MDDDNPSGSIVMESDDFVSYSEIYSLKDDSSICVNISMIQMRGLFYGSKPLEHTYPLLLVQLSIASLIILLCSRILRPLGQPSMIAQILGGLILGPSILGRLNGFTQNFFPLTSFVVLDALAGFGYMFYFFLIGVQIDPSTVLKKIHKKEVIIGASTVALALVLSISLSFLTMAKIHLLPTTLASLPVVATSQSVLCFPMMAQYLTELKIINSEFGRLALSCSIVSNLFGFVIITITTLSNNQTGDRYAVLKTLSTATAMATVIFAFKPVLTCLLKRKPKDEPLKEDFIYMTLVGVLVTAFASHATGLNIFFGPLVFGLSIPAGPPLGSALVARLGPINSWLFMPLYFVKNGLVTDIFNVKFKNYVVVQFIIIVACTGKFLGALISSLYCSIPAKDAIVLGLAMNVQGVIELGMYKMIKQAKVIDHQAFTTLCISMLVVVFTITILIRYLHDSSRRYAVYDNRSIMHARVNTELRVLACIHDQENVPITVSLLEALNPTRRSPIAVYVIHLIEISGRVQPLLINHKLSKRPSSKASTSKTIVNAFRYFEQHFYGFVSAHMYTAISGYKTMHDEICSMALENQVSLILIPFHKRFSTNSALEEFKKDVKVMNDNILDMAPCSVGIIVDRGLLHSSRPTLATWSSFRIGVLFLGGSDDREALAIGVRMVAQPNICLTVIRVIPEAGVANLDTRDSKLDNDVVSEFRLNMAGRNKVVYMEEVVRDGSGTVAALRSMENNYELIIVGRCHDQASPLVVGLAGWGEETELGTVGDIFASPDFRGNTSILVVQQHTISGYKWSERERGVGLDTPLDVEHESDYFPSRGATV